MATANPDGTLSSSLGSLQGILDKIIGSKTVGTDQRSLTTQQLLDNMLKQTSTGTETGTTTGTSNAIQNLISQITGTTNTTTQNTADVGALKQVFAQQQGGISPQALAAIFTEGAKAAPGLVSATANATGTRSGTNSPLATALTELNTNLISQAATQSQAMRNASAGTAAQIAQATGGSTTTGSTTQGQTSNTTNTGSTSQQQNIQKILDAMSNQVQNTNTGQQLRDDSTSTTGINTKQTGIAAGLAGLVSLFGSPQGQQLLGQGGNALKDLLTGLFNNNGSGSGAGTGLFTGGTGGIFDDGSSIPLPDGVGGYAQNPYTDPTGDTPSWSWDNFDFGFADGGVVDPKEPKLLGINDKVSNGAPNVAQLLALLGGGGGGLSIPGGGNSSGGTMSTIPLPVDNSGGDAASAGGGTGSSSVGTGTSTSISGISPSQAIGLIGAIASMSPIGIAQSIASIAQSIDISTTMDTPSTLSSDAAAIGLADSDPDANGSVGDDAAAADDGTTAGIADAIGAMGLGSDAGSIGDAGASADGDGGDGDGDGGDGGDGDGSGDGSGDGGDGSGDGGDGGDGDGGDGSGDGGDGGWANGGVIPKRKKDPMGISDGLTIRVSGGEGILPTDVVEAVGPDFVHSLIGLFHTPAAQQR